MTYEKRLGRCYGQNPLAKSLCRKAWKHQGGMWVAKLGEIHGDGGWENLYGKSPQMNLFGDEEYERARGVDGLVEIYKEKLAEFFGDRFLRKSRILRNSKNPSPFEFLFCVGNERGIGPAKNIANHILARV